MALYLDTSCFLKVFFPEAETARTIALIAAEPRVIVSSLTSLEVLSQLHARVVGGLLSAARARRLRERMTAVIGLAPYELIRCPADIIDIAQSQIEVLAKTGYCRTLDRLHLATMQASRRAAIADQRRYAGGSGAHARLRRSLAALDLHESCSYGTSCRPLVEFG